MIVSYLPILMILGLAILVPTGMLISTHILGPRVRVPTKDDAYECGVPGIPISSDGVTVKFYRIAILFLLFDVEASLLFPWAVIFREQLGDWQWPFLVATFALFVVILVVGYIYAWRRGALEWD